MHIKGRGDFIHEMRYCIESDSIILRIDDKQNLAFWLEIEISLEEFNKVITVTTDLEDYKSLIK